MTNTTPIIQNDTITRWRRSYRTLGAAPPAEADRLDAIAARLAAKVTARPKLAELADLIADPKTSDARLAKAMDASAAEAVTCAGARTDLDAVRPQLERLMVEALASGLPGLLDAARPAFIEAAEVVTRGVQVGIGQREFINKALLLDNHDALMMWEPVQFAAATLDSIDKALTDLFDGADVDRFRVVAGGRVYVTEDPEATAAMAEDRDLTYMEAHAEVLGHIAEAAALRRRQGRWSAFAAIPGVRLELGQFTHELLDSARDDYKRTQAAANAMSRVQISAA